MRGLTGTSGSGTRVAGSTATAGLVAFALFAAACSTGGSGLQDEGAAPSDHAAKATPSPAPSGSAGQFTRAVDAVELLKNDPKVSARVKADLRSCAKDSYPVDTSYGILTGSSAPDVVVNVMTCADAVGLGTYVYRENGDTYENVFAVEEPAVYSAIDRGDLVVTKQVYAKGDPVAEPSGEEVTTYRWTAGKFTQQFWVRNEYSRSVGEGEVVASDPPAPGN
ncbi:hypothetical protein [Streptomyces sp. NPDC018833]|uniref:hypothetical protein n=1 Tax=Streptomyces sp. NPDC018833 TaxID=3365053 RepID=UPI0037A4B982